MLPPELDPSALKTRAEFVYEVLGMWEECLQIIQRNPNGTDAEYGTKIELEAAIYVLKRTFPVSELVPREAYEKYRNQINDASI